MRFWLLPLACSLQLLSATSFAQTVAASGHHDSVAAPTAELRYVVYVSRHGVRSPTGKSAQYDVYSTGRWPAWPVLPGYLTPHGFHLMELFGAYDRMHLAEEGLLQAAGCGDASKLTFYADSDERTQETAKALVQGLMPGCDVPVASLPEGTNDPLFHPLVDPAANGASAEARAAIAGRIGANPANLTEAYHDQIAKLDQILAKCGTAPASKAKRTSLFDIPATLSEGSGDHLAEMKGPINTASTLAENLLLEYTEDMDDSQVGWGCVHRSEIQTFMSLHTAATDFTQRTPTIAKAQASNLLERIRLSIEQAVDHKVKPGALGKPSDRALFLIGHDTNIENISGTLSLTWIIDGRRDDTPPGGALIFEVWTTGTNGESFVRTYFTAQTLDQMRESSTLTSVNPPDRIPVFIPGCSAANMACSLPKFLQVLQAIARGLKPYRTY